MMRSRAQEQLTSKKSVIDKLHVEIAEHKHDVMLLRKQTEDVQKQQETLNEYLKALHPLLYNPKPLEGIYVDSRPLPADTPALQQLQLCNGECLGLLV